MMTANKYHAHKIHSNGKIFDSTFEFETYKAILSCGIDNVKIHYPIRIYESNQYFNHLDWRCDFYLPDHDLYIESKGFLHRDFKLRMMLLTNYNCHVWDRLILVTNKTTLNFVGNKNSLNLSQLKLLLRGKIKV